jgi:hypothetical protein
MPLPCYANCGDSMTDHRPTPPGERPKVEPEIIPPGTSGSAGRRPAWIWLTAGDRRARSVHIETRGPFGILVALLMLGVISAVVLAFLVGVVLLWIPVAVGLAVALILSWLFRGRGR